MYVEKCISHKSTAYFNKLNMPVLGVPREKNTQLHLLYRFQRMHHFPHAKFAKYPFPNASSH